MIALRFELKSMWHQDQWSFCHIPPCSGHCFYLPTLDSFFFLMTAIWFPSGDPSISNTVCWFCWDYKTESRRLCAPCLISQCLAFHLAMGNWLRNCPPSSGSPARPTTWDFDETIVKREHSFPEIVSCKDAKAWVPTGLVCLRLCFESLHDGKPLILDSLRLGLLVTLVERHQVLMEMFNLLDRPCLMPDYTLTFLLYRVM